MVSVALVHNPCMNKNGEEVTTAITNLDLHDLARVCLTYGVDTLYIVHPYPSQRTFARRITDHWLTGMGGTYNPIRKQALQVIHLVADLEEIRRETDALLIGTTAVERDRAMSWDTLRSMATSRDVCLVFGTGWGLAPRVLDELDAVAEPIRGSGEYNHLSVRSAVSITIDRILGGRQ